MGPFFANFVDVQKHDENRYVSTFLEQTTTIFNGYFLVQVRGPKKGQLGPDNNY